MRLDRFLSQGGLGSRSDVKKYIKAGRITVNGEVVKKADTHIDEENDRVFADNEEIKHTGLVYIMLNKPSGCVSAVSDKADKTVMDFIRQEDRKKDMFPVGRLDKDTTGLIIITNDGRFCHEKLSPKKHVDKVYYVKTDKPICKEDIQKFNDGIDIGDYICRSAKLEIISENEANLTISEGKFHQVKRMFKAVGKNVLYLKRIQFGGIKLDIEEGKYRFLSEEEIGVI